MESKFPFVGLHKCQQYPGTSVDIEYAEETNCIATLSMTPEQAAALWKYAAGDWSDKKIAVVKHDGFYSSSEPINPVALSIELA